VAGLACVMSEAVLEVHGNGFADRVRGGCTLLTSKPCDATRFHLLQAFSVYEFRPKVPHPRKPTPVSTADRIRKSDIPKLAPSFNPTARTLPTANAVHLRSLIYAFASDDGEFSDAMQISSDDEIVVLDSGTSCPISNDETDFDSIEPVQGVELKGIASGLAVKGVGVLRWKFFDTHG
jgi:hypothetical protein